MTKKHIGAFTEACLLSFIASNILLNCFLSGPMYDKTLTGVKKKPGKSGPACDRTMKTSRTLIRIRIRTLGKFWWMHTLTQFLHIILLSFLYPALTEYVSFIMQSLHIRVGIHPPPPWPYSQCHCHKTYHDSRDVGMVMWCLPCDLF